MRLRQYLEERKNDKENLYEIMDCTESIRIMEGVPSLFLGLLGDFFLDRDIIEESYVITVGNIWTRLVIDCEVLFNDTKR